MNFKNFFRPLPLGLFFGGIWLVAGAALWLFAEQIVGPTPMLAFTKGLITLVVHMGMALCAVGGLIYLGIFIWWVSKELGPAYEQVKREWGIVPSLEE